MSPPRTARTSSRLHKRTGPLLQFRLPVAPSATNLADQRGNSWTDSTRNIRAPLSSSWTKKGRAMATTATTDTNARRFSTMERYSSAVHAYQRKVTAWTLSGPHLDLTESIVEESGHTTAV